MRDYNFIKNKVQNYLDESKISKTQFAKECGISISSLNNILKANVGRLDIRVLLKVSRYFHCSIVSLLGA